MKGGKEIMNEKLMEVEREKEKERERQGEIEKKEKEEEKERNMHVDDYYFFQILFYLLYNFLFIFAPISFLI